MLVVEGLDALVNLEVELDIVEVSVLVDQFEGVARVAVHMGITVRSTAIREKNHELMCGFGVCRQIIPEHVGILEIGLRIALLGVDEKREFRGVAKEEDRGVVHYLQKLKISGCGEIMPRRKPRKAKYQIPIPLIRKELDGEPTRITSRIRRALFTTDSRESDKAGSLLADLAKHVHAGQIRNVIRDLKNAMRAGTLGVDDSAGKQLTA